MKKIIILALFICAIQLQAIFNPFSTTYNGAATINDKIFSDPLTVNGCLSGTKLKTKDVTVNGAASLSDSTIRGTINVSGSLSIDNSTIENKTTVRGSLEAKKSTFNDTIEVSGYVHLINSTAKDIYVKGKKSEVVLEGETTINGTIHFDSKKGKVIISSDTTITGGVKGGTVEKESKSIETGPIIKGEIKTKSDKK